MQKKQMLFKTKGMNQDLSVSAFNPEFSFENMNLRLSTNEGNTLMSWVNERGTSQITFKTGDGENFYMSGIPLGCAVINHVIILFVHSELPEKLDYIYKIFRKEDTPDTDFYVEELFAGDLELNTKYPLETHVSYESELVQKVYWTDGHKQPRVINVAGVIKKDIYGNYINTQFDFVPTLELKETVTVEKQLGATGMFAPGVIQYAFTYYNKYGQESNIFYTTPLQYISHRDRGASPEDKVGNAFKITVENVDTKFDYLRIYSIQRTSINGTPTCKRVQDIALADIESDTDTKQYVYSSSKPKVLVNGYWYSVNEVPRGEIRFTRTLTVQGVSVDCIGFDYSTDSFKSLKVITDKGTLSWSEKADSDHIIWISSETVTIDENTGFLVFETSGKSIAEVSASDFQDMSFSINRSLSGVHFIDTGTIGDIIDPTELLYKGGEEITVETMNQKDGTLFLGNISVERPNIDSKLKDSIKKGTEIGTDLRSIYPTIISKSSYIYRNQLTAFSSTEGKESVPCGGFKHKDYYRLGLQFQYNTGKWDDPIWIGDKQMDKFPSEKDDLVKLPEFVARLSKDSADDVMRLGYLKVRPVVVFPSIQDRVSICQGVVNTTLYTENHKDVNKDLHAQSDWFFRPPGNMDDFANEAEAIQPVGLYENKSVEGKDMEEKPLPPYLIYTMPGTNYIPDDIKRVEVQGSFNYENRFVINSDILTLHSPDIEFNEDLMNTNFDGMQPEITGKATIKTTLSDIDIQTETPTISSSGAGFDHKSFISENNGSSPNCVGLIM